MQVTSASNTHGLVRPDCLRRSSALFRHILFTVSRSLLYGDGNVDAHDHIKIVGRVDDVLNVSGHRIGTAELESTIIEVDGISEVAVVGLPHEIKEGVCAFVFIVISRHFVSSDHQALRASIGAHAKLDELYRISACRKLPGKCMRRVLRRLALDPRASLGDLSTLADPAVVEDIRRDLSRI